MYRAFFLTLARYRVVKKLVLMCPVTNRLVKRFVAGSSWDDARVVIASQLDKGLKVSLNYLGSDIRTAEQADRTADMYITMLHQIHNEGWGKDVDISVSLNTLGLLLHDGEQLAVGHAARIAAAAREAGTTVTLEMEGLATVAKTLRVVQSLRQSYPEVGGSLQANLRRTDADCRTLDATTSRLRLTKGSFKAPSQAAFSDKHEVDLSYVRCLKTLMEGVGTPLVATHDPVMIEIAQELAAHSNRGLRDFEFQMLYGVRTVEQERLVDVGHTVRVYVPFGENWYSYVVRRLAQRPANAIFFLRALLGAC
ncbi:MAG: proline dehydrogenase family protein [Propionibacteriaceae bacterium]|nr:proline dehydrogenase family protein [Propionibacteriaceae bacterium]